ncbi:MAG: disulfide bond formation protein B [Devosiaceae bacterium]
MSPMLKTGDFYPADARQARVALGVIAASIVVLAIAWGFQIVGGFTPCKLCLEQREGYYAAIPILAIAALSIALKWPACVPRGLLAIAGLLFAVSLVTGAFQAGAEWGFWPGPNDCGNGGLPTVSSGSLLDEIEQTTIIFCDEAALRVLGLSFAGWNVIAAGALTKACLFAAIWPPKKS